MANESILLVATLWRCWTSKMLQNINVNQSAKEKIQKNVHYKEEFRKKLKIHLGLQ